MRRVLILLPFVALVVCSGALVASAGLEAPPPPATSGYTVLLFGSDELSSDTTTTSLAGEDTGSTESTAAAPEPSGGFGASVHPTDSVQPLQGDGCELTRVNFETGELTPIAGTASFDACAGDLTFTPDGTLYGISARETAQQEFTHLVRFDTATGAVTDLGSITAFPSFGGFNESPIGGITSDATGTLYVVLGDADADPACDEVWCLYRIDDPSNPEAATLVGPVADDALVSTLAASCTTVYANTFVDGVEASVINTLDTSNAALDDIGELGPDHFVYGADFDNSGTFWSIVLEAGEETEFFVATLNPAGGTPIDTVGAPLVPPEGALFLNALTVEPLDCTPPEPIVLQPSFTG